MQAGEDFMSPGPATLASTAIVDSDDPRVVAFAARAGRGSSPRERAVSLYYAVRDEFRYDPYRIDLTVDGLRASSVLDLGYGWCVTKATLLAAAARSIGIPARLGFADVRNHLSTERMRRQLQTDLFVWHGYAELWVDDRWVKATPAFNIELTDRFGLAPLDWDGVSDSLYQAFDCVGNKHMEYVEQRGVFDDVPRQAIVEAFAATYPVWQIAGGTFSFESDVNRETRRPIDQDVAPTLEASAWS